MTAAMRKDASASRASRDTDKRARSGNRAGTTLRRYTDLTAAIDLLSRKSLTLLDPASWDDKNDAYFLRYYREHSDHQAVLALCLSTIGETYHHWRVLCPHPSGVCIEFNRRKLLNDIENVPGLRHGPVQYMRLEQIAAREQPLETLPFIKRWAFRHEDEYRLVYASAAATEQTHSLEIPLAAIEGITLSPWMPPSLLRATREALCAINGCADIRVARSQLISNQLWQSNAERAIRGTPCSRRGSKPARTDATAPVAPRTLSSRGYIDGRLCVFGPFKTVVPNVASDAVMSPMRPDLFDLKVLEYQYGRHARR